MSLNDVWRNINQEIGIFWKGRWDDVPAGPGVYAWFYPLRISTYDLSAFLDDVSRVLSFDARSKGTAEQAVRARFTWEDVAMQLRLEPTMSDVPADVANHWARIAADPEGFERLRRVVMRGSLFMPPLYVGKTSSLSMRCRQHLTGTGANDFHRRYHEFAESVSLRAREVNDLLFACIRTGREEQVERDSPDDEVVLEAVVEEILKRACRPRYSAK